jgi:hypothetical protein
MALMLAACSGDPAPALDTGRPSATATFSIGAAEVKPSTPAPTEALPTAARPTATFVPLITPSPTATGGGPSRADVPRIGVVDAKALADAGEALFVDVRTRATYQGEHITGSISIPVDEVARRYAELPEDRLIVFYCA